MPARGARSQGLCLAVVLGGCSGTSSGPGPSDTPSGIPAAFTITLERTVCFGSCPDYIVGIDQAGLVTWRGRSCVRQLGDATAMLQAGDARRAFQSLIDADFWSFQDSYTRPEDGCSLSTDAPSATIRVEADSTHKRVDDYLGCEGPPRLDELRALEDDLDVLMETAQWVGEGGDCF